MQERDWKTWLIWGLGTLVLLWVISSLFSGWSHGGAWGMMKPEMMGNWHSGPIGGRIGGWGFGPLGLLFGFMALMFRLGVLALIVLGGLWLFYRLSGDSLGAQVLPFTSRLRAILGATPAQVSCTNCGQPVRSNWRHCPHCGQPLPHANEEGGDSESAPPPETMHV